MKACDRCGEFGLDCRCHMSPHRIGASIQRFYDLLVENMEVLSEVKDSAKSDDEDKTWASARYDLASSLVDTYSEIFGTIIEYKR